ncbi:Carbonic anhydrase or acetyltransferase, isoleucine patch superfamily [Sphingobacterium nematocida]|uniref:Carbonic anhydrase or acetyltransferase, isoleucine patch superfamily n=1 Tax=Sphingobacterium nematocida TaxID=1513896 RepID=A0A1T5DHX2_9SPHI|nr:gamma carbonic anhydrase family protein [Sphingobacterium nematocida]SKB71090.1 Carbonic anhydrase or acetyltransferase, isoleucine patch superfamily [Sphingobacterium nematocida]
MAIILPVKESFPFIGDHTYLAPNSTIVGDVTIGEGCSVWFNAVIRGDVNYIKIGDFSNIQDNVTIHGTYERNGTDIGSYVNIGHNAIVHGCVIDSHVLVGMGAIVMDKAHIQNNVIIAAGAVVLENTVCESGFLYAGVPAKKIKPLTEEQLDLLQKLPHNYVKYASWFH